jgi:hypothetical protein
VLVASASFWEGFDAPGDALQLVVIDKLPFPPPNDPLVEARSQRLEAQGRSSFSDYSLPEAAVALKQGAGRLIRRETDSGVLAICDTRLVAMGYGRGCWRRCRRCGGWKRGGFRERHRRPETNPSRRRLSSEAMRGCGDSDLPELPPRVVPCP